MLDERKLSVLRAIVEDYVSTREPVGSKALAERHALGVSPATIRNDMALLEDEGYITQPHTSAGRVPTDTGYRLFVDRLATIKPLSAAERRAIGTFLEGAIDLDDIVLRTVRLLAQVTGQVAVVQYPSLTRSQVRHVEIVAMSPRRLMVVVISTTGRVEQRILDIAIDLDDETVAELRNRINEAVDGKLLSEMPDAAATVADSMPIEVRPAVAAILATMVESLAGEGEERVVLAGTANLALFGTDFPGSIQPVLEALEEHVVLLRLLGEATAPSQVSVRIGRELPVEGLSTTSLVSSTYGTAGAGHLGVIGPTRMDYPGTIGAVRAVAQYVGRILEESS
ncbi:MAG: heat-inducible transcriptional repressor HrcA [Actinomycetia bacterium]|nr:heat-inducible transcriptional repressor HrcA [Actinomycetes bacterium]